MKFKGIIFDLDGTIADTGGDLSNAINLMLESFGFAKNSQSDILKHINFGARAFVSGNLPEKVKTSPDFKDFFDEAFGRYIKFYEEHCLEKTYLYDGIAGLVKSLRENKIKMCVLSNKPDDLTKKVVGGLLNADDFAGIIGGSERFPHKPEPDSALYLAKKMNAESHEILFVGDSDVDMKTAINAKMFPLGATWGYRPESVLIESGAKKTVNNPGEILDFILNFKQ